jgi:RNA polymerase sigma-70 factor (ECF subfamily)
MRCAGHGDNCATIPGGWRRYMGVEVVGRTERGASLDAFRRFYGDASGAVYRYFVRATLGDRATAEDLTQETFAAVAIAARQGRADALTMPWVMGIARHKLVDHYRRASREQRRVERSWDRAQLVSDGDDDGGETVEVLRRLTTEHRLVLVLKYYEELPVEQIAATIGRSLDATNSLLSRARTAFARMREEQRS